jgi:hypothetical protein
MRRQYTPLLLLHLIRNRFANWVALCEYFGLDPTGFRFPSLTVQLKRELSRLKALNLISESDAGYAATDYWNDLCRTLGVSLSELARFDMAESMMVRPVFGTPKAVENDFDVFVAMPLSAALNLFYHDRIKRILQSQGLSAVRGDEFSTLNPVITDVWGAIIHCKFVVADCTGRDPNVFYEIGIAHTLGKRILLISQNRDDVPFNINSSPYLTYELSLGGFSEFDVRFNSNIKNIVTDLASAV